MFINITAWKSNLLCIVKKGGKDLIKAMMDLENVISKDTSGQIEILIFELIKYVTKSSKIIC